MPKINNSEKEVKLQKPKTYMKSIRFNEKEKELFDCWNKDVVKEIKVMLRLRVVSKTEIEQIIESELPNFEKISQLRKIKKNLFLKIREFKSWNATKKQIENIENQIAIVFNEIHLLKSLAITDNDYMKLEKFRNK